MIVINMKKLLLGVMILATGLAAQAGGRHFYHAGARFFGSPRVSFFWGGGFPAYAGYSYYSPANPYLYSYYPSYGYDYGYSRPNYVVNDTLTGALLGGIIGSSVHHQGWAGAGIGAAAGLVLGSLTEHQARTYERSYYSQPTTTYASPGYIANAPKVNPAATVPAAPVFESAGTGYQPASSMSGANSLFGR